MDCRDYSDGSYTCSHTNANSSSTDMENVDPAVIENTLVSSANTRSMFLAFQHVDRVGQSTIPANQHAALVDQPTSSSPGICNTFLSAGLTTTQMDSNHATVLPLSCRGHVGYRDCDANNHSSDACVYVTTLSVRYLNS